MTVLRRRDGITGGEKTTYGGALWLVLLTKYSGDQINNNEISVAGGSYGRQKICEEI
jgi:hypothetical protein